MLELFFQHVLAVSSVIAAILFAWYYFSCAKEISAVSNTVKKIAAAQDLVAAVENSERLAPAWKNFAKTLTHTPEKIYSTTDAAEFFSPQTFTRGMNMTFWQNYGGILAGVQSAFVTSLVGIFCAIVYGGVHHVLLKNFGERLKTLADKLDEKFPRRSAEDCLSDGLIETRSQTLLLKSIDTALDEKLAEHVEKICAAIDNLGADGSSKIGEVFANRVGDKLDRFSAVLEDFTNKTENVLFNAQEVSKVINDQLLAALKKHVTDSAAEPVKHSTAQLTSNLSATAAQMNDLAALSTRLAVFVENFDGIANEFERSTGIIRAAPEITTRQWKNAAIGRTRAGFVHDQHKRLDVGLARDLRLGAVVFRPELHASDGATYAKRLDAHGAVALPAGGNGTRRHKSFGRRAARDFENFRRRVVRRGACRRETARANRRTSSKDTPTT